MSRRRAAAPPDRPAGLLEPAGREHARPGDGHAAAAALRAPARARHRLRDHLPDRRPAPAPHPRRRHPAGGDPRPQHRDRGVLPRPGRPHDAGRDHPHAHAGRGHRGARVRHPRARVEGGHVRQRHVAPRVDVGRDRSGRGPPRRLVRRAGARQRPRLRPGLGEVPGARHRPDLPQLRQQPGPPAVAVELRLQPHRPLRRRGPRGVQGDLPRRRDPALPRAAVRVPRGRGRLGVPALRRPDRALGAAQRQGARADGPAQARPRAPVEPGREVRRRRRRGGASRARRLARPRARS